MAWVKNKTQRHRVHREDFLNLWALCVSVFKSFHLPPQKFVSSCVQSWIICCVLAFTACVPVTRPTLKIGLVAPFEGRYRDVGYEVIYATRLAVREANAQGGVGGYSIELIALDDSGQAAQAQEQARKLAVDPHVVGVIGHWLDETSLAAAPEYAAAGLPFFATTSATPLDQTAIRAWPEQTQLQATAQNFSRTAKALQCFYPCGDLENLDWLAQTRRITPEIPVIGPPLWGQPQLTALVGEQAEGLYFIAPAPLPPDTTDPTFAERYRAISNGVEPRAYAVLAYDLTRLLLKAIERQAQIGSVSRANLQATLLSLKFAGLGGNYVLEERPLDNNRRTMRAIDLPLQIYQWRRGVAQKP